MRDQRLGQARKHGGTDADAHERETERLPEPAFKMAYQHGRVADRGGSTTQQGNERKEEVKVPKMRCKQRKRGHARRQAEYRREHDGTWSETIRQHAPKRRAERKRVLAQSDRDRDGGTAPVEVMGEGTHKNPKRVKCDGPDRQREAEGGCGYGRPISIVLRGRFVCADRLRNMCHELTFPGLPSGQEMPSCARCFPF